MWPTLMLQKEMSVPNAKFPRLLLNSLKVYFISWGKTTSAESWVPQPLSSVQPHFWQHSIVVQPESCCSQRKRILLRVGRERRPAETVTCFLMSLTLIAAWYCKGIDEGKVLAGSIVLSWVRDWRALPDLSNPPPLYSLWSSIMF